MADRNGGRSTRTLRVDTLARVEGEGALRVRVRGDAVDSVEFRIYEPPRLFEALLRGRAFAEAPDITARICGICPIAYQLGASYAMEDALGVEVDGTLADLRRLVYCGEWIESHVLHAAFLHAPDFLGLQDAFQIAEARPELVEGALALKKLGNRILEVVGGRAVHPINLRVGGFHRAPDTRAVRDLAGELEQAVLDARALTEAFAGFDFPEHEHEYTFVSLRHPDRYAIESGRIVSSAGLAIDVADFHEHFVESHVARSNALHATMCDGTRYLVGPLARYANNADLLSEHARDTARAAGLGAVERNPFRSILVRMVETTYAFEEAARIAREYVAPECSHVAVEAGPGEGAGCTEAPRGICHHAYRLDAEGRIEWASIVPPTSQNQLQIEEDLRAVVQASLALDDAALTWRCEQTIRNYDPCISCATHFLDLTVERL